MSLQAGKVMGSVPDSVVDRVYEQLKIMAVGYELKPGERLNEGEISKSLGVSRTPLREALNRLNIEGFLNFVPGKGFFCRELDAQEVFDLYELRKAVEISAARLAIVRGRDEDIDALLTFLDKTGPDPGTRETSELVDLDEAFHIQLMNMSGNKEMLRVLRNVNARIRFVRWIDMGTNRFQTQAEHRNIALMLKARNEAGCVDALDRHISRRLDQITAAIRQGYAEIYMNAPRKAAR